MKTITFFSYKGGVGRTLAATNFAVYLAKLGLKVVIIDFDLDAPGVDSKFPDFRLPDNQLGLIDYILSFQRSGSPPSEVRSVSCSIRIASHRQEYTLGLIPAGDYLGADYPKKLNELDWSRIFSEDRDGVAFFQLLLDQIKTELAPDVLVIDSRTGFSEIGGLCTQQLADETVILSSLAKESIKMTRHLAKLIRGSEISKKLNKTVETKIVVCRVPRRRDIEKLKARCCEDFDVEERKLFFLFSCPVLEDEEFLAMLAAQRDESLFTSYIQLFQGLNVELAQKSIKEEIERTEKDVWSYKDPTQADSRIREMAALYPHPDVYRYAMRFFNFREKPEEASLFGLRLLELLPNDLDARMQVGRFVLRPDSNPLHIRPDSGMRKLLEITDIQRLASIAEQAYETRQLSIPETIRLADLLEDLKEPAKSYIIATDALRTAKIRDPDLRQNAIGIAARTAMKLDKKEEALQLISELPVTRLRGGLARLAIQGRIDKGEKKEAYELAKTILSRDLQSNLIEMAVMLADELGRRPELDELIRTHPDLEKGKVHDPEIYVVLERFGFDVAELWERSPYGRQRRHRA